MTETLLDFEVPGLRRDLRRIMARGHEEMFTVLLRIRLLKEEEGTALIGGLEQLGARFDPVVLHELRGRIRRLRYAAELGVAAGGPAEPIRRFREAQEMLGTLRDSWVLGQWLARQGAAAEKKERANEAEEARRLGAACEALRRDLHEGFLDSDPGASMRRAVGSVGRTRSAVRSPLTG